MITDPIADLITRIRNAAKAGHPAVTVPASRKKELVLNVLASEGYVDRVEKAELSGKPALKIYLRYDKDGRSVIRNLRGISRPGRRCYVRREAIPLTKNGLGVVIVSTPKGMLSDREARKQGVGGELICSVF
jgi:small subunit ribosomal protein S8